MPDWKAIREAAAGLGGDEPEEWGWLLWLDARLASENEPPITPLWRATLLDFWRSGRPYFVSAKGQRSTASTTITRCLAIETLLRKRDVVLDQLAVCVIMSAGTAEANQRCEPLGAVLRGVGLTKVDERSRLTESNYVASLSPQTGRSIFEALDADGHRVRWAIAPATREAASGSTGAGALVDELDLWREKDSGRNPADEVLTLLHGRIHGQGRAHIYHVSTPMGPRAPLSTMIGEAEKSGAEGLYVARLGELGARRDGEARAAFRHHLQRRATEAPDAAARAAAARWEADPRLSADPDPRSAAIPTWAARGGDPVQEILECWKLVGVQLKRGEEGGDPLDVLMSRYGAQPNADGSHRLFSPAIIAQARALAPAW
jgi:hypothetical protein